MILSILLALTPAAPSPLPIPYPIVVNGQKFANATIVNGEAAVAVEEFAKAIGGTSNLSEAGLQMQGTRMVALPAPLHYRPGRQKPGKIVVVKDWSSQVITSNGKAYIPLSEIARAFGGVFTAFPRNLKPGETIRMNFAPNPSAAMSIK